MEHRFRKDVVGKRFLCVAAAATAAGVAGAAAAAQETAPPETWSWRCGVIRAASHCDSSHDELQVSYF